MLGFHLLGRPAIAIQILCTECPQLDGKRTSHDAILPAMETSRHTITNDRDVPIYISIEPRPECYELEPGDKLTVVFQVPKEGDSLVVSFVNDDELVIWPNEQLDEPEVLFNGASAEGRSWMFKHR